MMSRSGGPHAWDPSTPGARAEVENGGGGG